MDKRESNTTFVKIKDDISNCLGEELNKQNKDERRPKGYVELYDIDENINLKNSNIEKELENGTFLGRYDAEPIIKDDNLIVFDGREWVITSLFGIDNSNIHPKSDDKIYWVGFGDGGAPTEDPFNPIAPDQDDSDLENSVMINETESEYGDYRESPVTGYYKKLFSNVQYEQDELNEDKYVIAKITITLTSADANDHLINEAGLFIANSNTPGYSGDFNLFSKVTFQSVSKNETRQLVFIWYVYS